MSKLNLPDLSKMPKPFSRQEIDKVITDFQALGSLQGTIITNRLLGFFETRGIRGSHDPAIVAFFRRLEKYTKEAQFAQEQAKQQTPDTKPAEAAPITFPTSREVNKGLS